MINDDMHVMFAWQTGRPTRVSNPITDLHYRLISKLKELELPPYRYGLSSWRDFITAIHPPRLMLLLCSHLVKIATRRAAHVIGDRGLELDDLKFDRVPMFGGKAFKLRMEIRQGAAKNSDIITWFKVMDGRMTDHITP